MTDDFDDIVSREFGDDFGARAEDGVLTPAKADDHIALHVLEGLLQVTACLDAFEYVTPYIHDPVFPLIAEFGINGWLDAVDIDENIDTNDPRARAFCVAVRDIGTDLALALESFLRAHGLERVIFMVHLSNHGWHPMVITSGEDWK